VDLMGGDEVRREAENRPREATVRLFISFSLDGAPPEGFQTEELGFRRVTPVQVRKVRLEKQQRQGEQSGAY
jgi:hypothetical protein